MGSHRVTARQRGRKGIMARDCGTQSDGMNRLREETVKILDAAPGGPATTRRTTRSRATSMADFAAILKEQGMPTLDNFHWGWVVVLASFICIGIVDGVGYTVGILLESLQSDLGGGRAEIAVAGSLQVGVYSLSGPMVSKLIDRFGTRVVCISGALISFLGLFSASYATHLSSVYLSYSVFTGLGFGLMYLPSVVGVAPYFEERRALAIGICLCGSGVGTFSLAPISQFILDNYGWRWVLRTFSAICLFCTICGAAMVPVDVPSNTRKKYEIENKSPEDTSTCKKIMGMAIGKELIENPGIVLFFIVTIADFLAFTGIYIPYTHLPTLARSENIQPGDVAFLISVGGISNTLGRLVGGWLSDLPWTHPVYIVLVSVTLSIVPSLLLPSCVAYWTFLFCFGFFGFVTGCLVGSTSPMLVSILDLKSLPQAFGLMTAFRGIAALVGPPSAGILVDAYRSPGLALYMTGWFMCGATVFQGLAALYKRIHSRRREYSQL